MSRYDYRLCTWHVRSEILLPELPAWGARDDGVTNDEVVIEEGSLPECLGGQAADGQWLNIGDDGTVLLHIPRLVRIQVSEGRTIRVQRLNLQEDGWRLFLLGSALSYLCLQRGVFPLHAACLRVGTRTLAIVGHSGAGKSTLAASLLARGHRLLSDDLTVLRVRAADAGITVLPAFPRLKLWRDTLDALAISCAGMPRVREGLDKYDLRPDTEFDPAACALDAVLILRDAPQLQLRRCTQAEALPLVHRYLSRPHAAERLGLGATTFAQAAAVARAVPVWGLQRPRRFDALQATADLIESQFGV